MKKKKKKAADAIVVATETSGPYLCVQAVHGPFKSDAEARAFLVIECRSNGYVTSLKPPKP